MSPFDASKKENIHVLVVDDEAVIVDAVADTLNSHGYHVVPFTDSLEAGKYLPGRSFNLALIDINMPNKDGAVLTQEFLRHNRGAEVIIITGIPDETNLDSFLNMGLTHFLFKPFNKSQLIYTVYAALHFQRLRMSYVKKIAEGKSSKLVGISQPIRDLRQEILMLTNIEIPVFITGESGTGKEIIAHELHSHSNRSSKPFLPINCATLKDLAESELFGHAKGSFTGSVASTSGHVGASEGGTLFLDEIGELSLDIQAKLLRFLDTGEYMRVGESILRYADIRIVAATNRDLDDMCNKGLFREDLFYRLSGVTITTVPLRRRKEDIVPLIWHFLSQFGTSQNRTFNISAEASDRLAMEAWPGNVRQLKQTLFKIVQMSDSNKIVLYDVEKIMGEGEKKDHPPFKAAKQHAVEEFERNYLLKTLQISQGNLKKALALSGMHKKNFYTKINNLGLLLKDFHPPND